MSLTLTLDLGSSYFKACLFKGLAPMSPIFSIPIPTHMNGNEVEVLPSKVDRTLDALLSHFRSKAKAIERIIFANQSPSLTLISKKGTLLHPIITHLDRRSHLEAKWLEESFGKHRWLKTTGNRPYPGGIAATSLLWIQRNRPQALEQARVLGCLNTYAIGKLTGQYCMDPANASFMGLYNTLGLNGWSRDLCHLLKIDLARLPNISEANQTAGYLAKDHARRYGFNAGIAVRVGTMDTSACALAQVLMPGDLIHISGTTDVLATLTQNPQPSVNYLTRGLGMGRYWLFVRSAAAVGPTLKWCEQIFGRVSLFKAPSRPISFSPYLAGDRLSLEPKSGAFLNLSLSSTKEDMKNAVIKALLDQSLESLRVLASAQKLTGRVYSTGANQRFANLCHQVWKETLSRNWSFHYNKDLGFRGLAKIAQEEVCS